MTAAHPLPLDTWLDAARHSWPAEQLSDWPKFERIVRFCAASVTPEQPRGGFSGKGNLDAAHVEKLARKFRQARSAAVVLKPVQTAADPAVEAIAVSAGRLDQAQAHQASEHHRLLMQAENVLGQQLERYLASQLEPLGWVWCSGDFVRAVDFIHVAPGGVPTVLQVKNSDNSENSSSAAIRAGTTILKWYRRVSKTGETCWPTLNAILAGCGTPAQLSEAQFTEFIRRHPARPRGA